MFISLTVYNYTVNNFVHVLIRSGSQIGRTLGMSFSKILN